mmetsp:Transcript_122252/g.237711  ORF Transcript_122252/g.237711 Transcript_122252/m.237711 type:complete len:86 (-) Transcript_122252:1719-1976(-)
MPCAGPPSEGTTIAEAPSFEGAPHRRPHEHAHVTCLLEDCVRAAVATASAREMLQVTPSAWETLQVTPSAVATRPAQMGLQLTST